jgi:hypothetical protein
MSGLISKSQLTLIVADQLLPLLMMIIGNSIVIIAIVKQSQNSLRLHAKAAHCFVSAAKLADVRRDILHRVTPLNGIIVGSVGAMTAAIVRILKLAGQYEYTGVFFGFFATYLRDILALEKCQNIHMDVHFIINVTAPLCRMAFSHCPLAFFKRRDNDIVVSSY